MRDIGGFLAAEPGYLSCVLVPAVDVEVALADAHLAPDLRGDTGWSVIGTMEGAFDLDGLGDAAEWSDGSRSDNQTNSTMLQLRVDQHGTQSFIQAWGSEPQLEYVDEWTVPQVILLLAAFNESIG